jgi:hypothetical protein
VPEVTRAEPVLTEPTKPGVSIWLKLFVVFHLFVITAWTLPRPPDELTGGRMKPGGTDWILVADQKYIKPQPILQAYLGVTGLWQYWDMFAPDAANADWYCDAFVFYKDGHSEHYQYPRMYLLPIPEKFFKERYRKYFERARDENYEYVFRPFAQRIAYLMDKYPDNPPIRVDLHRHVYMISPPGQPPAKGYSDDCYFRYAVDEDLLRKEKVGLE